MRFPSASSSTKRAQRRFHRIRVGVVAVVEKLHAADFLDLQARFRERGRGEAGGTFLHGKSKCPPGGDGQQRILHHVRTRQREVARGNDARPRQL